MPDQDPPSVEPSPAPPCGPLSAREFALELERLRSGFVGTLVREVRLPLTNVMGVLELFESKLAAREPFDMEDRQLLMVAIEQSNRIRRLIDDLLEVTQQQERPLALSAEETGAGELLDEAVEPLRGEAALRGVEIDIRVAAGTPALDIDRPQARRALRHLVCAALAATPDGGRVGVETQTITGTRAADAWRRFVIINVSDSGEGIPADELPYVYDAFWCGSDPRRGAGGGIGLAIAKRIAVAHGGHTAVRSIAGLGTTYSILFPACESAISRGPRHILVVEDTPDLLLLLHKLIGRMGYRVSTARDAERALRVLEDQAVDLLVTDWAMPGMSGRDLIAALRHDPRLGALPIVVLTGHDDERDEARAAGCDRFLVKPVMSAELQRVFDELLPRPAPDTFAHADLLGSERQ